MPVKFVTGDIGDSSIGNTSAVVSYVGKLADSIKNLDVNSKNLDTEIKVKNAAAIELFHLYKTLKEEGITGKGVEELGKSLESLNKTIEETAKRLGREVEEVHVESLGPKIHQYLKASEGSPEEEAALKELHENYHKYHTKNGMPQHYDVYEIDKFGEKAAELKKILLGYGDIGISPISPLYNGGTGGGSPKIIGGQAGQAPQPTQPQSPVQPQQPTQQTPQKFTYTVGGDGLVGKDMAGVKLPDFLRDVTSFSAKLNIILSGKAAREEYSEQSITKDLDSALDRIRNDLEIIVNYTSNSNIKTQYLEGMLKELDDFKNNHIVSKDVKQFIDTELDVLLGAIKNNNNNFKGAVKNMNDAMRAIGRYVRSTRSDEVGKLEIAGLLDDAAQKIAKEGNKLSKIAKGSPALAPSRVEKKIYADIDAAEHFWIAEQLYALIASKVILELNAQLREIIVTGGKNEKAIKKELLNKIESYRNV